MTESTLFKVGDEVEFQVDNTGVPRWNHTKLYRNNYNGLFFWSRSRAIYVTKVSVETGYPAGSIWLWTICPETLAQPGYIRLIDQIVQPLNCQCPSFDLCHFGHLPTCPSAPKLKRNKYL